MAQTFGTKSDFIRQLVAQSNKSEVVLKHSCFELHLRRLKDASEAQFVSLEGNLETTAKAHLMISPKFTIVEYFSQKPGAEIERNHKYNAIAEVVAVSATASYRYSPVATSANPYANLAKFDGVDHAIEKQVDYLTGFAEAQTKISGQPLEAFLSYPGLQFQESSDGEVVLRSAGSEGSTTYKLELVFRTKLGIELLSSEVVSESPEGSTTQKCRIMTKEWRGKSIPSQVVVFNSSLTQSGTISYIDVAEVIPVECEGFPQSLTDDFFRRYEREYTIVDSRKGVVNTINAVPPQYQAPYADRMQDGEVKPRAKTYIYVALLLCSAVVIAVMLRRVWRK